LHLKFFLHERLNTVAPRLGLNKELENMLSKDEFAKKN